MFGGLHRCRGEDVDFLLEFIGKFDRNTRHFWLCGRLVQERTELRDVLLVGRVHTDHRHSEVFGEVVEIYDRPALSGDVHHGDDDHHRNLKLAHEKCKVEVAFDGCCVYDVYVKVGLVRKYVFKARFFVFARSG